MHLHELHEGKRVKIVKGNYSGRFATFLAPAGLLGISAKLDVEGDERAYRTLRLASLEHANPPVPSPTTTRSNVSPTVDRKQADMESVIQKVAEIEALMTSLKIDLEKIQSDSMS